VARHRLHLVGLHMHIGSGVDYGHLQQVCAAMVDLVKRAGVAIEAISAGGGLSIPYRDGEPRLDTAHYFQLWDAARREIASHLGRDVHLELEPGRYLVAESGVLLTEVRATKHMGRQRFTLVDAGFSDLMRPAMYGAYHGMSLLPADDSPRAEVDTVVAGPLCESGDVFTQADGGVVLTRRLPEARVGDLLVLHDAGLRRLHVQQLQHPRPGGRGAGRWGHPPPDPPPPDGGGTDRPGERLSALRDDNAGFAAKTPTMSTLKERITEDMKAAMRAKEAERLGTIRLLLAACKQKEVDERIELDDAAVIAVVDKLIKQRKDSVAAYSQAGRTDLADKESAEIAVLEVYLPQRLSEAEIAEAVAAIVAEVGATGPGDMGKVMGAVKSRLAGKADMGLASAAVKKALQP
jgi:uncharacterized protein YqeY